MSARTDERIQPALHTLLLGDVDGLRADPGPYRPNWADVGRPAGAAPSDDPRETLGEAFVFAALNDRSAVVDFLLDTGVEIDSRSYCNTTALHFAIQFRRHEMVRRLLGRGATVTIEDDTYQSDAAGWRLRQRWRSRNRHSRTHQHRLVVRNTPTP